MASDRKKKNTGTFTLDPENTMEMPSVTKLLNRKSLEKISTSTPEPEEINVEENVNVTEAPAPELSNPKIQRASRRGSKEGTRPLVTWHLAQIENGTDPLGRAIAKLFQKGAGGVLYLAISPPPAGSSLPVFLATAMAGENVQPEIWTGMRWDPRVVPDIWNVFVKSGLLELPPPSANTNIKSSRNVVRDAFGIALSDWITLVRTGPANACRGMLGFVSRESIIMAVKDLLPLLNAKMPGK